MSQLQSKPRPKSKPKTTRAIMDASMKEAFGIATEEEAEKQPKGPKSKKKSAFDKLVEDIKGGRSLGESISEGLQKVMDGEDGE